MIYAMEKSRSKLVKSKSSNSALTKSNKKDKKSRSNGALQTSIIKKRGMYVESKPSEESVKTQGVTTQKEKLPAQPSRDLIHSSTSVLTNISKSSNDGKRKVISDKTKTKKKKSFKHNLYEKMNSKEITKIGRNNGKKAEYKYKSKILRNQVKDDIKFEILKPRHNLDTTSSVNSDTSKIEKDEFDNIKWSDFLPRLVYPDEDEGIIEKERKLSHLVREVTEGRMIEETKVKTIDEPPTLVSEHKNDKGLFNFFVDLLETTFSVYNVTAEYDASPNIASTVSSQIALEIDESVAKKLNVGFDSPNEPSPNPSKYYLLRNNGQFWYDAKSPKKFSLSPSSKPRRSRQVSPSRSPLKKKRMKSESFALPKHQQNQPSHSKSAISPPRKSYNKNSTKKYLLGLLKEQLKMDVYPMEEPQSLYQALKVMAKTKRKSRKTIRFEKSIKIDNEYDDMCMFKSRKVISPRKSRLMKMNSESTNNRRPMSPRSSHFSRSYTKSPAALESNHSLEVFNIDYDQGGRRQKSNRSPSNSEHNFQKYDALLKHVLNKVEAIRKARSCSSANTMSSRNS